MALTDLSTLSDLERETFIEKVKQQGLEATEDDVISCIRYYIFVHGTALENTSKKSASIGVRRKKASEVEVTIDLDF